MTQARSTVAAVDIGTNSTRLLVTGDHGDLERVSRITRLGQGVDRTRLLHPDAIERTLACLADYRAAIDRHGATAVRAVATSAARDAANAAELFDRAEQVLGVRPEVVSGAEEGRLAFAGATGWAVRMQPPSHEPPFCVIDIGGGSTELIVGTEGPERVISLDVGSVRLTEAELHGDPPRPEELANAIAIVQTELDDALRAIPAIAEAATYVGIAGTITTVAAVELGLATYDRERVHGLPLSRDAAEDVFRTLATEALADRVHNPGLERARADVIVGGCCVLVTIMRRLAIDSLVVSDADLLDGVAAALRTAT